MIASKVPSRTLDKTTSALVLSQFRRHFRCSHADQITGPSTDSGLDLFNTGARQITLGDVEHYLGPLRSHSFERRCGRCQAAAIVRPDRVVMIVRAWQRQLRATKVRALR
jgi:hypothetical protein